MKGFRRRLHLGYVLVLGSVICAAASGQQVVLSRANATVALQGFAPNVVRVTLSLDHDAALAAPGVGIVAAGNATGWSHTAGNDGDTYRSDKLVVHVSPESHGKPGGTQGDIARYFNGSTPHVGIWIGTAAGATLLDMHDWQMSVPNHKDGNADVLNDRRPGDPPFFQVGATFASPGDEHYYGLGQNQEGFLDLRGHSLDCAHDYTAPAGPSICVPFVVTNKG
jgi:alpha-D-xyloside xylohydrolase